MDEARELRRREHNCREEPFTEFIGSRGFLGLARPRPGLRGRRVARRRREPAPQARSKLGGALPRHTTALDYPLDSPVDVTWLTPTLP